MRRIGLSWWLWLVAVLVVACGGSPGEALEQTGQSSAAVVSGGATAFAFSALPATIQAGTTGTFTVRAVDGSGNTATGYVGTVHFTANYPATTFSADYTFTPADLGAHAFQFTPKEAGTQILYATDTADLLGPGLRHGGLHRRFGDAVLDLQPHQRQRAQRGRRVHVRPHGLRRLLERRHDLQR